MSSSDFVYDAHAAFGVNLGRDGNAAQQVVMQWIAPYESRLHRAVVIDEHRVLLTSFVSVTDEIPAEYRLGAPPEWITERLAVLRMLPLPPPPNLVPDVGMRIDATTFWIIGPENANGQDA